MRSKRLVVLLVPALIVGVLSGCSADPPAVATATKAPGDNWVVVDQGVVPPSASAGARTPAPGLSTGFLPRSTASTTPTPTAAPKCVSFQRQGLINGLTAVPATRSVSVTWYNPGGANLVSYRLTAIPQHLRSGYQPDLIWQTITPEPDCGMMTAVVTGLVSGDPYMLSLDAVTTRGSGAGVAATIARSGLFYPA